MLVAQRIAGPVPAGWAVVFIEAGGSGTAALLMTMWLHRRIQRLVHAIPIRAARARERDFHRPLRRSFAEVIPTWRNAVKTMQTEARKRTEEAARGITKR